MTRSTYVPVLILVISFFVFFGFFAAADQCTIQAGIYYDVSLVRDCFRSIPFDETIRKDTVKQLRNLIEAYSFTERSKNSGAPFFINVDLQAEIDRMETAPYLCDFDFHADVNEVFNRLGDAHTCYQAPLGYSSFIKLFPFGVVGVSNPDGSFRGLKVNSLVQSQHDDYASATGVELDDYIGETIVRIQGRDALEYVQAVGDRAGISKSDGVRFNFALMANSFKGQIVGSTTGLSTDDYYNIEFDYGEVLKIKILAVSTRSFTSKNDIVQANQFPSLSSFAKTDPELWRRPIASVRKHGPFIDPLKKEHETVRNYVSAPKRDGNETIEREKKHMKQRHGKLSRFISYAPIFEEHELVKPFVSYSSEVQHAENVHIDGTVWSYVAQSFDLSVTCFYSGDANQPLILRIHSFNPPTDELSEAWVKSAVQTIDTCFKFGRDHAIDNLIVDVRCNGGGLICAAIAASQMFNPSEYIIDKDTTSNMYKIMMPYDLKKTATTQKLVDSDLLNADRNDPLTGEKLTDYIWFEDTVWSNMHGVSGEFTAKTYFPGDCVLNFPVQDYVTDPIQPPFKKIIIYTDGMCGSACSLFITKLRYAGIGAIVAKGGRTDTIIESASFSGGNVFEWDDVVASYGEILDFEYFPTSASARFNFNEMYAENQVIPREFMRLDPDYRILNWDFSEDTAINNSRPSYYEYDKVIPFFDDEDFDKKIAGNLLPEFRPPAVDKQGNEHTYRFDGTFCIEETDVSVSRQVVMVQNASAPWSICSSPDNTLCIENDVADSTKVYLIDGNVRRNCAVTWTTNNDRGTLCCGDSLLTSANVISTSDTCSHTLIFSRKHCGGNPAPLNFHVEVLSMQLVVMGWNKSSVGDMLGYVLQYSNSKTFASPAENMVPGDSLKTVLGGFEPNQRYYARLAVNTIAGVGNWSEIVSFSLPLRNPFAVIEGGSQLARAGDVVVFDGGRSYDPNSKTFGNSALLYTWSCTGKCDSYEYVITTANQQNSQKLQITVSSSSASSIESVTINMHVALKTDESIISSISSVLKALPHGSAISPMEIQLIGGVLESSSMISVQQPLRLWCETTGTRNIEWSVLMPDFPMDPFDLASFSSTGIHQSLLLIPGGMLESITYSFTVRDVNAIDANVTRDFTILPEPQIGTIEIEPLVLGDQIPFSSTFRVSVSGWTSYRPLQYAFFVLYDQGGIQMRLPLRGGPSFSTSIETTLPSPTPTDTSEVVILVKAYDDIGGVAWSTKPFTLSPKTSTADETLTLAHNLRTSVDPTKPFPDISEQLTSLILVLENTIENKSSLTTEEIEDLFSIVFSNTRIREVSCSEISGNGFVGSTDVRRLCANVKVSSAVEVLGESVNGFVDHATPPMSS
eukprot:TRINITY_DN2007_c0_g1_i5.p1 TRINITY_DN2007_c0_g1~~TRINITY_DN2007_c0_g1_i5.p1  ORF type:complete len:1366 (+),score=295.80 TRINITY_DN2007_c0_g1_i5:79-4176(+)